MRFAWSQTTLGGIGILIGGIGALLSRLGCCCIRLTRKSRNNNSNEPKEK